MNRALLLLLALALSVSGCIESLPGAQFENADADDGADGADTSDESANDAEESLDEAPPAPETEPGQDPAPPEPHGDVERTDGDVTTENDQNGWVAKKHVTLHNGVGDATRVALDLIVDYADVVIVPADVGGYTLTLDVAVRADTKTDAEDGMDRLDLRHVDNLLLDTLTLGLAPHVANPTPLPINTNLDPQTSLSYDLVVEVPYALAYDLLLDADYTDLVSGPLAWDRLDLNVDYTDLAFSGADGLQDLVADMDYSDLVVHGIDPEGGAWSLNMDYSDVILVTDDGAGYDVQGEADYSDVEVHLPDVEDLGDEDDDAFHYRTRGYDDEAVQVDLTADMDYSELVVRGA